MACPYTGKLFLFRNDSPYGHESANAMNRKARAFHESPTLSALLLIFIATMQSIALQFMERSEKS